MTDELLGHTCGETEHLQHNAHWCTTEQFLSNYCLMLTVNSLDLDELKTFQEAWWDPDLE